MVILFYAQYMLKGSNEILRNHRRYFKRKLIQKYNHWMCSIKQLFLFSKTHWKTAVQESLF